jgi:hypothetical protein
MSSYTLESVRIAQLAIRSTIREKHDAAGAPWLPAAPSRSQVFQTCKPEIWPAVHPVFAVMFTRK